MCLSTIYKLGNGSEEFLYKNISKVEIEKDRLIFTDIMGIRTEEKGHIRDIDLIENIIRISNDK